MSNLRVADMLASSVLEEPLIPPLAEERLIAVATPGEAQVHWFSPYRVATCTFFGGPLAGTALLWLNARAARSQQQTEIYLGLLASVAVLITACIVPSGVSLSAFSVYSLHYLAKIQLASYVREQPKPLPRRGWIQLQVVLAALVASLLLGILAVAIRSFVASGMVHA